MREYSPRLLVQHSIFEEDTRGRYSRATLDMFEIAGLHLAVSLMMNARSGLSRTPSKTDKKILSILSKKIGVLPEGTTRDSYSDNVTRAWCYKSRCSCRNNPANAG
jgi:hypothetical protein